MSALCMALDDVHNENLQSLCGSLSTIRRSEIQTVFLTLIVETVTRAGTYMGPREVAPNDMVIGAFQYGYANLRIFGLNVAVAFPILGNLIRNCIELASALLAVCHCGLDATMITIWRVVKYDRTALPRICSK